MVRKFHFPAILVVVSVLLSACQASGLKQTFEGTLPIDGKITFTN